MDGQSSLITLQHEESVLLFLSPPDQPQTHLDDSHGQPGLLGQLLSDVSRGLGRLVECRLQDLQLLRLDRGPRAASLRPAAAVVGALVLTGVSAVGIAVQGALETERGESLEDPQGNNLTALVLT